MKSTYITFKHSGRVRGRAFALTQKNIDGMSELLGRDVSSELEFLSASQGWRANTFGQFKDEVIAALKGTKS